jgi:hypothetical protein
MVHTPIWGSAPHPRLSSCRGRSVSKREGVHRVSAVRCRSTAKDPLTQALDPGFVLEDITENERTLLDPFRDPIIVWASEARMELSQLADPGRRPVDPTVWKHMKSLLDAQVAIVAAVERAHDECTWLILDKNRKRVHAGHVASATTGVQAVWSVAKVLQTELRALAITTSLR